jgi:hypothetical protein
MNDQEGMEGPWTRVLAGDSSEKHSSILRYLKVFLH